MSSSGTFRILLMALAVTVGSYANVSAVAEVPALGRTTFPADAAEIGARWTRAAPSLLGTRSPSGSELESNHALIGALQTIQSGQHRPTILRAGARAGARSRGRRT